MIETRPARRRGRPKKLVTLDYEQIKTLAKFGMKDEEISAFLKMTRKTFFERRKEDPALDAALKTGKIEADLNVIKSLYTRAISGQDTTASIFWLKNRQPDRWRDRRDLTIDEPQGAVFEFKFSDEIEPDGELAQGEDEMAASQTADTKTGEEAAFTPEPGAGEPEPESGGEL